MISSPWTFRPAAALALARAVERGDRAIVPFELETALAYGGPARRALRSLAASGGELKLFSPYLARVARGEIQWNAVHRAEFERLLATHGRLEIALPEGPTDRLARAYPAARWASSAGSRASAADRAKIIMAEIFSEFCVAIGADRAARIALELPTHERWNREEWEPARPAAALLFALRTDAARDRLRIPLELFELARREWARFECAFHPADFSPPPGRGLIAANPASAVIALETGGQYARGPLLWAVARAEDDELVESRLEKPHAVLLDELDEFGGAAAPLLDIIARAAASAGLEAAELQKAALDLARMKIAWLSA